MHRFYLPPGEARGKELTLTGAEAHHAAGVLRLRPGDDATVLDGAGAELACQIQGIDRRAATLVVKQRKIHPPPASRVTLAQAIPRGKIIESIIQKATELGAARIAPLLTDRVATRLDGADAEEKAAKWRQVAVEAIKQCGQPWLPRVDAPVSPAEFLALHETFELALVGSLEGDGRHPREWFAAARAALGRAPLSICLWIGPEGDFTPQELAAIRGSGARPITLGPLVLRSETAAVYAMSVANYETSI